MVDKVENSRYKASNDRVPLNQYPLSDKKKEETIDIFFDNIKDNDYNITLTQRGDNAQENKYNTGVSFNLMYDENGIRDLYDAGIFVDVTKNAAGVDEFTREDKLALEAKFKEIHERNKMDPNFKRMQAGDQFNYTYEEFIELAKAAGYRLKAELEIEKNKDKIKAAGLDIAPVEATIDDKKIKPIEIKPISPKGEESEGEKVKVRWTKETITDENGNITVVTDKSSIKYLGKKDKVKGKDKAEHKNEEVKPESTPSPMPTQAKADTPLASVAAVPQTETKTEQPAATVKVQPKQASTNITDNSSEEEIIAGLETYMKEHGIDENMNSSDRAAELRKVYSGLERNIKAIEAELEQGGTTVTKKRVFKNDKKEVKEFTEEEKAQKEAELATLKQEYENGRRYHAYVQSAQGIGWGSTQGYNPSPNLDGTENPRYNPETVVIDGKRQNIAVIETFNNSTRTNDKTYHPVKVVETKDKYTGKQRYEVVADTDKEIAKEQITFATGNTPKEREISYEEFEKIPRYGNFNTKFD